MSSETGLSAAALLEVVDAGSDATAAGRGSVLLAAALPDTPQEARDELTLGRRDAWLLELRCATLGDTLAARVACGACGTSLSVRIPREHVAPRPEAHELGPAPLLRLEVGDVTVEARSPDAAALEAAAACLDVTLARASLISSCIVSAVRQGEPVDPLRLDAATLEAIGEALLEAEPELELHVPMSCAHCGRDWAPVLDIVQFFWRELEVAGAQLVEEVHQLATGYGWTEQQSLALSSRRRRQYVERLLSD